MAEPTIIFIAGRGHSGSTLLDMLLSSHSKVASVGEARFSPQYPKTRCSCGAPAVWECPYWKSVDTRLSARDGMSLRDLDIWARDDATFIRHNKIFYGLMQEITGKSYIVDSSKKPHRLRRLLASGAFDVRPIHILREPHGVVFSYSAKRQRGSWVEQSILYTKCILATNNALRGRDHRLVRYDRLAETPEQTIRELTAWLGLEFEPQQMSFHGRERHDCGGNPMRLKSGGGSIKVDRAWKTGLTTLQKVGISLLTLPTRAT
jgi:hypothetical protein